MDLTRRKTLYGSSLVALTALAGCLEDTPVSSETASQGENGDDDNGDDDSSDGESLEAESDSENIDTDDSGDDDGAEGYALADYETFTYSVGQGETDAEALFSKSDADDVIDDSQVSTETSKEIDGFLEETDFETSKIVFLSVETPTPCYDLEIETVDVDDDGVVIEAGAVEEDREDEACPFVIQYLQTLVRMEFEGEVPTSGSVRLTDGSGKSHGIGYGAVTDEGTDTDGD